ncbi:MAG: beta-ketoacyl-ACP synthase III [Motilibacteraceae bacterium]
MSGLQLRQTVGAPGSQILGVGSYRPSRVVTNEEICELIDSSDEWIRSRTGIVTRHRAAPDESVVDMSAVASGKALAHAGIAPEDVDCVLVATVTHPYQTPAAAPELATRIGAVKASAFDISAACAGFAHGVGVADSLIRTGQARYVLVVGCEKLSDFVDPTDRSTAFIFGDGGGAVVIGPSDTPGIGPTVWGADGAQKDAITMNESWVGVRDGKAEHSVLTMQGQSVFRWAVWQMAPVCLQALEAAGVSAEDLDVFIPHQANNRITDAMIKELKLPESVVVARDIVTTGNTSAGSIPLALDALIQSGQAPSGGLALLIGFGAGLAYAAQVVRLP